MRSLRFLAFLLVLFPPAARADVTRSLERYQGQVVVLNFWAAWCAPCRREIPVLAEVQRRYGPRGVQVIGASIDEPEDRQAAEDFVREMRIPYPVWYGHTTGDMTVLKLATAIPATAIYDRDGRQVFRLIGEVSEPDLTSRLDWLLGPRTAAAPSALALPAGITPEHFAEHEAGEEEDEEHHHEEQEGGSAVPT